MNNNNLANLLKNRMFILILLIEAFTLTGVFMQVFRPGRGPIGFPVMNAQEIYTGSAETFMDEEGYFIKDGQEGDALLYSGISLPGDEYILQVDCEMTNGRFASVSLITDSKTNDQIMYLDNDDIRDTGFISIKGKGVENASLIVHYGGGVMEISSIKLIPMSRFYMILRYLVPFLIIDFLYILIFTDVIKIGRDKKTIVIVLTLIVLFSSLPMFADFNFGGHDFNFAQKRIRCVAEELRAFNIPPRNYSYMNNGYGYAAPIYYGDIFLYFPALLFLAGVPIYSAYHIYYILLNLFTAGISYFVFKRIFKGDGIALFGTFMYVCAPYRIICIYRRAAMGEATAMTFLPLIIYGIYLLITKRKDIEAYKGEAFFALVFGASGIVQSHILTVEMVTLFLVFTVIWYFRQLFTGSNIIVIGKSIAAVILVNLSFIVPFLTYYAKEKVYINDMNEKSISESNILPAQLFSLGIPTKGFDVPDTTTDEMPFTFGLAFFVGLIILLLFFLYNEKLADIRDLNIAGAAADHGLTKKNSGHVNNADNEDMDDSGNIRDTDEISSLNEIFELGRTTSILGITALLFTTIYMPWDQLMELNIVFQKLIRALQYPWRFLSLASVFMTFTLVSAIYLWDKKLSKIAFSRIIIAGSILFLSSLSIIQVCAFYADYMNTIYTRRVYDSKEETLNSDLLYLPTDRNVSYKKKAVEKVGDIYAYLEDEPDGRIELSVYVKDKGGEGGEIYVPKLFYTGYSALDTKGNALEVYKSPNATVAVRIPPDFNDNISVRFTGLPVWKACTVVSLISLVILVLYLLYQPVLARKKSVKFQ